MTKNNSLQEISQFLASTKRVVLISHFNPDADALGSTFGLGLALQELGKEVLFVNESAAPPRYHFLPSISALKNQLPGGDWDSLVILDCGEMKRIGDSLHKDAARFKNILNIDHHLTNDYFGAFNLVEVKASSTSELVFEVLQAMKFKGSTQVATCLLSGISGDTGSFKYASTSVRTLETAAELLRWGAKPVEISGALYGDTPLQQIRLESLALSKMQILEGGAYAEVLVTEEMFRECGANADDTEFLVEKARDVKGVRISALIRRDADLWKVSLRARGSLNVADIAAKFGGGGHKPAAAFRWRKDLGGLQRGLREEVKKELQNERSDSTSR